MDFLTLFRACTCEGDLHADPTVSPSSNNSNDSPYTTAYHQKTHDEVQSHLIAMHYNLGCSCQEEGRLDEAIKCYQNVLLIDDTYCDAQYNLANALQLAGRIVEAEQEYLRTIALNPHHQLAYYNLGYVYFNDLKDPWKGIEMLKKSLEIDPSDVDAQINMALALNDLGMLDDVIKCYEYIIEHNPSCVMAHFNLGNAFLDAGKIDEALNCFQVCALHLPSL
jgi:protein O-GlcNAc transferase